MWKLGACICVWVCGCICMCAFVHADVHEYVGACIFMEHMVTYMCAWVHGCMYARMCACMSAGVCAHMPVSVPGGPRKGSQHLPVSTAFETRCPQGMKVIHYRKAKLEKWCPYLNSNGLVSRLTTYQDLECKGAQQWGFDFRTLGTSCYSPSVCGQQLGAGGECCPPGCSK